MSARLLSMWSFIHQYEVDLFSCSPGNTVTYGHWNSYNVKYSYDVSILHCAVQLGPERSESVQ